MEKDKIEKLLENSLTKVRFLKKDLRAVLTQIQAQRSGDDTNGKKEK